MRLFFACFVLLFSLTGRAQVYTISTIAGSDWVGDGGPATSAIVLQAEGLAADGDGNLYIADAADQRVRRVAPDGTISTVAGTGIRGFSGDGGPAAAAQLNSPYGLAFDTRGNLYIADLGNARVRRVARDGTITTIAGGGELPAGGPNEGTAAALLALEEPRNLALDSSGNLFISDFSGHRVYRLAVDGSLTTVAGTGVQGNAGDGGAANRAQLAFPAGLAVDAEGSLYIADSGNHAIRKVARGVISTIASAATPAGLAFDGSGVLYVADPSAGEILNEGTGARGQGTAAQDLAFFEGSLYASVGGFVLKFNSSGSVVVAGGGDLAHGDGGAAIGARLNHPAGVAVDAAGNVYIADRDHHRIRRISKDGIITTVAGTGVAGDWGDGAPAAYAELNRPSSVALDSEGNLFIADTGNHRVRKVTPDGRIVAVKADGLVSPVYAMPGSFRDLYIADEGAGSIVKVTSGGDTVTLLSGLASPRGLALDRQGNLYFTEASGARVSRLAPDGTVMSIAPGEWNIPRGVTVDSPGDIFVADTGLQRIVRVDAAGEAQPVAGTGTAGFSGDGGDALAAQLGFPWDVAIGPGGAIEIADLDNNRIRALAPEAADLALPDAVNAASGEPGPVASGTILLVRNSGLGAAEIADTQAMFGSEPGTILGARADGLLVLAPQKLTGGALGLFYDGKLRAEIPLTVADSAPALFADASGGALANNEDGTLNTQSNPAARGSIVSLYGTGLGAAGLPVSVSMGGDSAQVLYAGPVAGDPGLFQINARIPSGYLAPGRLSVTVAAGAASSQPGVFLWTK
ncbi:MAG TPA: hypothetical protein VFW83_10220 [Bryobacteraceae bacterium]|nr:hypothetical protein [Bryobacteraceae bacterium]